MIGSRIINSFKNAGRGLKYVFGRELNFRLQVFAAFLVIIGMYFFPLRAWEIILLILMMVMVLTMELLNSALEQFADLLKPRLHDYVWVVKDIMAAAVLVTSVGAASVGLIIFLPHFLNLLK